MSDMKQFFGGSGGGLGIKPMDRKVYTHWAGKQQANIYLPIPRSAVNHSLQRPTSASGNYLLINEDNQTTIATITPANVQAAGTGQQWLGAIHYETAAQAFYVIAFNSANLFQLAKIDDTTGAVTLIGSGFTPATSTNWTQGGAATFMWKSSGNIYINHVTKQHIVNGTTGALISQDVTRTIGGVSAAIGSQACGAYEATDNSFAMGIISTQASGGTSYTINNFKKGNLALDYLFVHFSDIFTAPAPDSDLVTVPVLYDTDTIVLANSLTTNREVPWRVFTRSEWERVMKAIANKLTHGVY